MVRTTIKILIRDASGNLLKDSHQLCPPIVHLSYLANLLSIMTQQDEKSREVEVREQIKTLKKEREAIAVQNVIDLLDKERQALFKADYRVTPRKIENVAKCLILSKSMATETHSRKRCAQRYFSKVKDISEELFILSAFASFKNTGTTFGNVNDFRTSVILNWWEGTAHPPALKQYCGGFFPICKSSLPWSYSKETNIIS